MTVEFEIIEVIDGDADHYDRSAEYSVVESNSDAAEYALILEELEAPEEAEEAIGEDADSYEDVEPVEPEIQEPESDNIMFAESPIEFTFKSKPVDLAGQLHQRVTIKDMFGIVRNSLPRIATIDDELWFNIQPLGLSIGEENTYAREPTLSDLLLLLENADDNFDELAHQTLRVEIQCRESFYSKFRDLLDNLRLSSGDDLASSDDSSPAKKARTT